MQLEFSGEIIHWRGPSPFYFVTVPDEESAAIEAVSSIVTYGWGSDSRAGSHRPDRLHDIAVPER